MRGWRIILILMALSAIPSTAALAVAPQVIVCIQCHAAQPGRLSKPVTRWQTSIHSEHGIACNACHGGDPMNAVNSMNPANGFRGVPPPTSSPALCGGCHMGVTKHYMNSAHGLALGRGGPTCVTCHGSHAIVSASLALINKKNCSSCHTFDKALMIRNAMVKTDRMLKAIEKRITVLKSQGIETDPLEMKLFSLRNQFHAMFHSLDVTLIRKESAHIQAEIEKTNGAGGVGTGHLVGILAIGWALLAALLFSLIKKNID
ncbi:MAG TPA: cytochrome C [Desulfuromonadales bacterium]|nr:cytochrome C [Desulfuromonadales bacterium]